MHRVQGNFTALFFFFCFEERRNCRKEGRKKEGKKVGCKEFFRKWGGCGLDSLGSEYGPVLKSCKEYQ